MRVAHTGALGQSGASSSIPPASRPPNAANNAPHGRHVTGSRRRQKSCTQRHVTPSRRLPTPARSRPRTPRHRPPMTPTTFPSNATSPPRTARRMVGRRGPEQPRGGEGRRGGCAGGTTSYSSFPGGFRIRRGGRGLQWCPLFLPLRRFLFPRRVQRGGVQSTRRLVFLPFLRPPRALLPRRRQRGGVNTMRRLVFILFLCPQGLSSMG